MDNPFKFGEPVTGSHYVDRDNSTAILTNARAYENTVVFGERSIGKSSLFAETARRSTRDFISVNIGGRAIADHNHFFDCLTRSVMKAGMGRAWSISPALDSLLTTRRMRAAVLADGGFETPDDLPSAALKNARQDASRTAAMGASKVKMCPRCGGPSKWIETYKRHYCYSCKEYLPWRRKRTSDRTRDMGTSNTPETCPRCSSNMRYVHRYSDYYCSKCERYPLVDGTLALGPWTSEDMDAALDLPQKLADLKGKPVLAMFDDIDQVAKLDGGRLARAMRLRFEEHDDVVYAFAGNAEESTRQMFENKKGPFFKFAKPTELERVADTDMLRFLMRRFRYGGGMLSEEAGNRIVAVSEGMPSYAQQISHELFRISANPELSDIDLAVETTIRHHSPAYEIIWNSIRSPLHRRYLYAIAREPKAPHGEGFIRRHGLKSRSHVQRIQTQLEARGIIRHREIIDPLFLKWIRASDST